MAIRNYRQNTIETVRLAIESRRYMFEMAEREKIDFDLERRGILHFYRDKASYDKASKANELLQEGGLVDRRPVTPEEIRQIEPTLKGSYYGGFFTPSDSTGDIHKFTRGLAEAAPAVACDSSTTPKSRASFPKNGGYEIRWLPVAPDDEEVAAANVWRPTQVDGVVICAGTASRRFAAMLGDRLNIYPVKGYSITVNLDTPESRDAAPTVSILDDATKIVTSRLGRDRFRVAGTAEFSGYQPGHPPRPDPAADRVVPRAVPENGHGQSRRLVRPAADDARHDAAGGAWPPSRRVLQHGPRPSGLDPVGRNGAEGGGCRRKSHAGSEEAPSSPSPRLSVRPNRTGTVHGTVFALVGGQRCAA